MPPPASPLPTPPVSVLPPTAAMLAQQADQLERAARGGVSPQPLAGRHLGVLCADEQAEPVPQFIAAAQALGARITRLDPARALDGGASVEEVGRMLGRLYGAVACHGLPAAVTRRLAMAAAVPVLDVRAVLATSGGQEIGVERRRWIAQAALIAALR
ncbi:hypothetical protein [Mitsuaria sp. GD03876]|uniref:hypothetical protein n=1 Tax=Mitsuaria sp. GD03876 TaxID=2975399 RepID=UPI0024481C34|nr:hypothetical protein [Mitsuaria sp. GD03876]MDH0866598.1 hypothetical protein [Mitsuaria sp. GD03876]